MPSISGAIADLAFGLRLAAKRYSEFAVRDDVADSSNLYMELATERKADADNLIESSGEAGVSLTEPTLDPEAGNSFFGLGFGPPASAAGAAWRVQRAENRLDRMAAQLLSFTDIGAINAALRRVRDHIESHRDPVREACPG